MHLLNVDSKTSSGIELARAVLALEMLGLLMLHEHFLVLELSFAVPAPWFEHEFILFLSHR